MSEERTYIDCLEAVAIQDVAQLKEKDKSYGGSWKKRGGVGAYMMAARKIDRIEVQLSRVPFNAAHPPQYDIFAHLASDSRPDGILDDIRDLRRYLLLIEAEMMAQGVVIL